MNVSEQISQLKNQVKRLEIRLTQNRAAVHADVSLPNTIAAVLTDHNLAAHTGLGLFDQSSDVDHDATTNFVADEHVAHSTVSVIAGTGLTGGGTIAANRTLNVDVGIADNKIVQIDHAAVIDNDYAKFTASGLEGRSYSEVLGDLSGQAGAAFDWNSQDLTSVGTIGCAGPLTITDGTVMIKEQAAAEDDVAGYGQLWVKNEAPCELWFTDDDGTDTQLGVGGAGGAPTDASYLTLGLDGDLSAERVLTAGTGVQFTDAGVNGTLTVASKDSEIDHDSLSNFVANEHLPGIDEDDMASDSDAHVPTQQSVKAYVDDNIGGGGAMEFLDNFGDASKYWAWREFNTDAARTITEAGGKLSFHIDSGTNGHLSATVDAGPYSLMGLPAGPCVIEAKGESFSANNNSAVGIMICNRPGAAVADRFLAIMRYKTSTTNGVLVYRPGTGGVLATVAPWANDPFYFRISVSGLSTYGHKIVLDYSSDGSSWTTAYTEILTDFVYHNYGWMVGLFARNWDDYPETDIDFDYFQITQDVGPG